MNKNQTLLLSHEDAQYFLKFYKQMLSNLEGKIIKNPQGYVEARNKLYKAKKKRIQFTPIDSDHDFKESVQKAILGLFIFLKKTNKGYLIKNDKTGNIYLIKGITDLLENLIEEFSVIKTAILPFRGQIISDGLIEKHFLLGPNMIKELKQEIKTKQKNEEIIYEM